MCIASRTFKQIRQSNIESSAHSILITEFVVVREREGEKERAKENKSTKLNNNSCQT